MYSFQNLQLITYGRQDCRDLHSWGPGMRQCYILHYVLKGAGTLVTDKKSYLIQSGQSFLIYPYTTIHYYPDPENPWEYIWVDFIGEQVSQLLSQTAFSPAFLVCPYLHSNRLLSAFHQLDGLDIFHKNKAESNGLLLTILGIYADTFPSKKETQTPKEDRFSTAQMLIHSYAHKADFCIETLCNSLHISRATLYRLFQLKTGQAPQEYLLQYRLKLASTMLLKGSSVKNTALSCGFSDPFYFSKVFKNYYGTAPSHYPSEHTTKIPYPDNAIREK